MTPTDPAVASSARLTTVDEFWEFVNRPENDGRFFELRKGRMVEFSRPTKPHGRVCIRVGAVLERYAEQVGKGYVVGNDLGVVLAEDPGTVVGPDVAYFTDANTFDDLHPKWGEVAPILAVEVLSPNDKPSEINEKIEDYLKSGVKLVWLVDHEKKKVTVYRPDRILAVLKDADELAGGDELPGFTCEVADFFRLPGEQAPQPPVPPA